MKIFLNIFLLFLLYITDLEAQTSYNINNVNGTTITSCNSILYDSGGPTGTYQNGENYSVTFCSGTTDCLQLQFQGIFGVESGWDYLYVHDGANTSTNIIATLAGNSLPGTLTTSGNCVTLHFTSDGSVTYDGFQINITCTGNCYVPPPPPTNDDPCSAFSLTVNSSCNFTQYTCQAATGTTVVPAPTCGFSYAGGDVWFSAVVPASGLLAIQLGPVVMNEGGIAIYSGADCNNLTEIMCDEQTWGALPGIQYIGSTYGLAGQTVWIRVWEADNDNPGIFDICAFEPPPFLEVNSTTYTPQQLVEDILVTGCLVASNVVYDGPPAAIGIFNNGGVFGLQSGVIMGSGTVEDIYGTDTYSDNLTWTTSSNDVMNNISSISASNGGSTSIYDQIVLEFDFVPSSATTEFKFVFSSEEYPTFEHTSFNDVFGFFVSGPGISGPYADASINVAVIPGTNIPITISTVNSTDNSAYFAGYVTPGPTFNTGGYTIPIMATMSNLTPCETYHIKFVIADAGDGSLNSYVMFEANSFSSGGDVAMNHYSSLPIADEVLEGCDNYFVFSRIDTTDLSDSLLVQLIISGTAINGTDYTPIPSSFWIHAGETSDTIYYSAILDNLVEPTEYIVLSLTNGCPCNTTTFSDTIFILNNFSLNPTISNDTLVCSGQPVTINTSVNPNIDTSLLTYIWSTGETTPSILVNPSIPTIYYVTINDPCAQDTVMQCQVTIVPPLSPSFSISSDTVCINDITTITFTGTAGPSALYQWDFNGGTPANANTAGPHNVSWSTPGTKPIVFSINDNGCTGDSTINVVVLQNPQINLTPNALTCFGNSTGSINTTETGTVTPYSYIWSNGSTAQNPTNLAAGIYSVTASNPYGCSNTASTTVTQPTLLTLSTTSIAVSCYGANNGSASGFGSGGTTAYSYVWNDPLNQNTSTATNLIAGNYSLTITDANGCTATSSVIVTQPASSLSISGVTQDVSCFGFADGNIEVTVAGGTNPITYSWNNLAITPIIINLTAGNYTVTATDANGCTLSNSWTITEPLALTHSNITTNTSCFGTSDGSVALIVNNGTPPYLYEWSNHANTATLTGVTAGTYSVTVTDSHNCKFTDSYIITEPQKVFVSTSSNQTICIGQSATITASATGGTSPYVFHWNNGSSQTNITVSPTSETTYFLFATDANQCPSNVASSIISVNPAISANYQISNNSICLGEGTTITVNASGGNGNYSYMIDGSPASVPINLFPEQTHTYTIIVSDNCGSPTSTLSVPVVVKQLPPVNFYADIDHGCVPLTVHFIEVNPNIGQSYLWNFGDDSYNQTSTEKNPVHIFENDGVFNVDLEVTSADGCKNHYTQIDWINVYPQPESHFTAEPRLTSFIKPTIHFMNLSSIAENSFWYFGDGDSSQVTNPWHTFPATPGYYDVGLIVQSENGCLDTAYLQIQITDEYTFYAPTAFSPDNDGKNDFFFVMGHGIVENTFTLEIFDRWGSLIWNTISISDQWNGETSSGKKAPVGTYTWLVHYKDNNGIAHEYSGPLTIIR